MSPDAKTHIEGRRQLERLQAELSARESVLHFAHAAVSMLAALILGGASGKMFWDLTPNEWIYSGTVGVVAFGLVIYSVVRMVLGRRIYRIERERFKDLQALRRSLHVDDPSVLLPQ